MPDSARTTRGRFARTGAAVHGARASATEKHRHARLGPRQLDRVRGAPAARLSRSRRTHRGHRRVALAPAARLRGRGAQPHRRAGRGGGGPRLPAPGRRLRGKLRRVPPRHHPRHVPRDPADGGGAHLCVQAAGGEARPDGGPVRQAALRPHRDDRRRHAAHLPRRQRQRHRLHRRRPRPRSAADGARLQPVGGDAQPAARLCAGGVREPPPDPSLDARLPRLLALESPVPRDRRPDR